MKKTDKEKRDIKLKNKALYHAEQMYLALLELNVFHVGKTEPVDTILASADVYVWKRDDGVDIMINSILSRYKAFKKSEKIENVLKKSKP